MARIENHKYSIEEAFRECFYIVPDYQREYVWTDKEVHQLLEDIGEQIDVGTTREYFIGTVLVSPTDQKNHYEVIDGQQRLTTFFLLLCALRRLLQQEPEAEHLKRLISDSYTGNTGIVTRLKLDPRYESAAEVMAKVVEINGDPVAVRSGVQASGIASFGSLENLINAYSTLYRYLKDNYDDDAKLKKYWFYLATNVVFIQISTDVSSALKIFETINERGVGLNPMDLLKNLLFTQVKQTQFTQLKDEWKKITKPLEKEKEKPLRFLRYFLMANYTIKNERGDAVVREDEIYDWFIAKDNAALCDYEGKPFEFVRKVIRNVEHYLAFANGLGNDGKPSLAMDSLKRLAGGAFSLHYVLLLAAANFPKPLFDHFVAQLESFLFYYIFTKTPTKDLERSFSQWADELRTISEASDPVKQKVQLNTFIADRFEKNMAGKSQELADALKRFTLYSMQQYRTRYLLARLTQHVEMAFSGLKTPGSLEPFTKLEIEHILPDNPKAELRARWAAENPNAAYDDYKNRLGNLTLLEKPINIVAGNDFYAAKQVEYGKSGNYLTRSLLALTDVGQNTSISRINTKLAAFPTWNAASIEKRHAMLIALSQEVWKTAAIDI
ncbi:DUF262 domain-containing protein [Dyella ginsengisoli]|uniref:DUF262 domain-containing protein n=1 Tax=Dyella ginsengisoli TaxID=363848 RepID=UPI000344BEB5|nr:DUF262 domain-containing protein [Dyella ginsengisoli]